MIPLLTIVLLSAAGFVFSCYACRCRHRRAVKAWCGGRLRLYCPDCQRYSPGVQMGSSKMGGAAR